MKKKQKHVLISLGICLSILLAIPLYAVWDDEDADSKPGGPIGDCPKENIPGVDVLLPDSKNCALFYKCDWGTAVLFSCPDDLYFNVEKNRCDHLENVECDRFKVHL